MTQPHGRIVSIRFIPSVTRMASHPSILPEYIQSGVIGRLTRESYDMPDGETFYYYVAEVDLPWHKGVTVVVHPDRDEVFDEAATVKEAERRFVRLAAGADSIVASSPEKLRELFISYYEDQTDVPTSALLDDLRLTHIKIICGRDDELIYYGNPHYLSFDLNLTVSADNRVKDMWFDG